MIIRYRVWSESGVASASTQSSSSCPPSRLLVSAISCVGGTEVDKVCRITVLLEDSSQVVNFLLNVVLCADDPSGPVVEPSHHTSFHVVLKVEILVRAWASCRQRHPDCHSLFFWLVCRGKGASHLPAPQWTWWLAWPRRSSSAEPFLSMQNVSSTEHTSSKPWVGSVPSPVPAPQRTPCRSWPPLTGESIAAPSFCCFLHSWSRWTSGTSPVALQSILGRERSCPPASHLP